MEFYITLDHKNNYLNLLAAPAWDLRNSVPSGLKKAENLFLSRKLNDNQSKENKERNIAFANPPH